MRLHPKRGLSYRIQKYYLVFSKDAGSVLFNKHLNVNMAILDGRVVFLQ